MILRLELGLIYLRIVVFSLIIKKPLNPQITQGYWVDKCIPQAGVLLPPRAKLKAYCESLFTPFRTVIGGPCLGSGIHTPHPALSVEEDFPLQIEDEQPIEDLVRFQGIEFFLE